MHEKDKISKRVLFAIIVFFLVYYNILNNEDFFKVNIIVVGASFLVAYYIEQKKDVREEKEFIERIIDSMYSVVQDRNMCYIENENDYRRFLLLSKKLSNKIELLSSFEDYFACNKNFEHLVATFEMYQNNTGEIVGNYCKLKSTERERERDTTVIENQLDRLLLDIYRATIN